MLLTIAAACALVAIDGDTLRCGDERIRLLGIDAPELPGHCRRNRHCAPGDPWRAQQALTQSLRGRAQIERVGFDRYGRTLATVRVRGKDLSCLQLASGNAIYVQRWDNGGRVAASCPSMLAITVSDRRSRYASPGTSRARRVRHEAR